MGVDIIARGLAMALQPSSTIGDRPLSGRQLVDMLAPELSESGNPIICHPVASYPLGITARWEPQQAGSGDPSPDNVRPFVGRNSVAVTRCAENVLEFLSTNKFSNNIEITADSEKNITLNGTLPLNGNIDIATCRLHWVPGKKYSLYAKKISGNAYLGSGDGITFAFSLFLSDFSQFFRGSTNSENFDKYIVTAPALEATDLILMLQCWRAGTRFDNCKFQIEVFEGGTVPLEYSPYTEQTVSLPVPDGVIGGSLDVGAGAGLQEYGLVQLDGDKLKCTAANDKYWNFPPQSAKNCVWTAKIPSSHFSPDFFGVNENHNMLFASIEKAAANGFNSPDDFNAYLAAQYAAGTPVQLVYKLATPIPFTANGAQTIRALPGTNTIFTDAARVDVTGRTDPVYILNELQDAVASII